ncbi:CLUMA_CG001416, isoform A [Clunio marinus]|uniref:GPI inositol-deacylase n=1 Tax=Clunio marinus TaxID=568069 RepID=A0A1J1HJN1_9DIPT|nr:CLUMA_CG001416, isoform A [Clunio marinus]
MIANSIFILFSFVCITLYLYGVLLTFSSVNHGNNDCKMTFMFEHPNYVKIDFEENESFPKYNLYAYSEGQLTENARNLIFNGAPVLFIPGNSGSYKQARSLASVALRKGIDNDWFRHLDYFTVDLNEEYAALYGGVLHDQTQFIEHSISAILKLYNRLPFPPKKIVIVAHSIAGKIAQKLLSSPDTAELINTVITLASPMDKPVLNLDHHIDSFYKSVEGYWIKNRFIDEPLNSTCGVKRRKKLSNDQEKRKLDEKLLITIGGGNKDLLVHSGLTDSKFSDIHAMTTAISKVWVESDHLCIVWCLQLVLVVNRFLYSIIAPTQYKGPISKGLSFIEEKEARLRKAEQYFLGLPPIPTNKEKTRKIDSPEKAEWLEDNRRIFTHQFKNGINRTRIQMIRLVDNFLYHSVRVDVINRETNEWIYGCEAIETTSSSRFCSYATLLPTNIVRKIPPQYPDHENFLLNLHELKAKNPKWTHVLLRFAPTREPFQYTVDIHNPSDRQIMFTMPKWYSFSTYKILDDTLLGASYYQFNVTDLDEQHQALEIIVTPKHCSKHITVGKVCIPWISGFDRYHQFEDNKNMILWTPKTRPLNYNTTNYPIQLELFLDPTCRYTIEIKQSFGQLLSKIVQQFSHWLPAHLVALICLSIKHQIGLTPSGEKFKCGSLYKALGTCTPFFVMTVSRLFLKIIVLMKILPKPEVLPTSLTVSIIIHGTALALLTILTGLIWTGITFCASIAHKILFKIVHLPIPILSDTCISIIEKFPASVAALLIALAFSSCGGIALIVGCFVYFILLSKMYEDYLENFVFNTAKLIAMKLFGRVRKSQNSEVIEEPKKSEEVEKPIVTSEVESEAEDKEEEEKISQLLEEAMKKQREEKAKRDKELASSRIEYDSLTEGLSDINFHLPIFYLLLMSAMFSLPSVVTWARNYHYSKQLSPDPMLIPATCILTALGFIWQMPTPRNLYYYKAVGHFLYVTAVVSVLYCQDAIFKLNYVITAVIVVIAIHQFLAPKKQNDDEEAPPDFFDNLKTNFEKLREVKGFVQK